ncbi:hypothetical protein EV652_110318 [Kribbella steppae]|uniref:Uncharacterized protein n=1 Tax=Kribbella steppae TaxID=2512223 RepID=A0A4V2RYV3_9ACTN|nr:hypothetical protein EV652_110318 [Kribbella steppae]
MGELLQFARVTCSALTLPGADRQSFGLVVDLILLSVPMVHFWAGSVLLQRSVRSGAPL